MLTARTFWCECGTYANSSTSSSGYGTGWLNCSSVFHSVPDCSYPSLVIPPYVNIVLDIFIRSHLRDNQLRLVLCPSIILCPIHILPFTTHRCVLVLAIREHLLVIDRSRRRDLLVHVELWLYLDSHSQPSRSESSTHGTSTRGTLKLAK
jgi:hypothetical protein